MANDHHYQDDDTPEPPPFAHLLDELQLYGYRPFGDEPDPRPLPEAPRAAGALADVFDAFVSTFVDTRLEPDLDDVLWNVVNGLHRKLGRIERELDDNEQAQRQMQREQDGSEVKSVELERLLAEGIGTVERRNAFEFLRDTAAELYDTHTGHHWRPLTGSMASHRTMTAAMIDSRDFIMAKRRSEAELLVPVGARIGFTGGEQCNDVDAIWTALDRVRTKHVEMVLLHGGATKGAELIASRWATSRKVPQIAFKPDWNRHKRAAPFKRNDQLLNAMPIGMVVFPGTGIQDNLADKARKLGIPLFDFRKGGA